ncbi:MAG: acyl transferase [Saprospiraceae bacterium]
METPLREEILSRIRELKAAEFENVAEMLFQYQKLNNPLYAHYLDLLGEKPIRPFLPVSLFKSHDIQSGEWKPATFFESSGTTGQIPSRLPVRDMSLYLENAKNCFHKYYGNPEEYCFLALLPNYLERGNSSLVAMTDHFIHISKYEQSGFFLDEYSRLHDTLDLCISKGYKTILLGVSYALLDFAEEYPMKLGDTIVMETGGMKGRRKELTKAELHHQLKKAFHVDTIHAEYGMTELFSQAYAQGNAIFAPGPTMRVIATEPNDPFCLVPSGKTGVLNIIDLANVDTMAFIQTEDLGRVYEDGRFEVIGRLDAAELRGCNLMVNG